MSRRKRVDRELGRYLQRKSVLSRAYSETPGEEPPPELDATILAEARRAVRDRPRLVPTPFARNWVVPASLAAILVLTVGLVRFTFKETGEPVLPKTAPERRVESTLEEMRKRESVDTLGAVEPGDAGKPSAGQAPLERKGNATDPAVPVAQDTAAVKSDVVTDEPPAAAAVPLMKQRAAQDRPPARAQPGAASPPPRRTTTAAEIEEQATEGDQARAYERRSRDDQPTAGLAAALEAKKMSSKRAALTSADRPESLAQPEVIVANGIPALRLPDSLTAVIANTFPGFRVPDHRDLKEQWAYDPDTYPRFAAWGDFNGDDLIDVALILISRDAYKRVIFNQTAEGYVPALELGADVDSAQVQILEPQRLYVSVIPKGQRFTIQGVEKEDTVEFLGEYDAVNIGVFGSSQSIVFWQQGKYQVQSIDRL